MNWTHVRWLSIILLGVSVKMLTVSDPAVWKVAVNNLAGLIGIWAGLKCWYISIERQRVRR